MRAPCPPLPPVPDASIGALAREDAAAAGEYARCQAKHAAVVAAFDVVAAEIAALVKRLDK